MPTIVASTPNCARILAFERLDEPLPSAAFSTTVTRQPRSASRTAASALVAPPPISTTRSPVAAIAALRLQRSPVALMIAEQRTRHWAYAWHWVLGDKTLKGGYQAGQH